MTNLLGIVASIAVYASYTWQKPWCFIGAAIFVLCIIGMKLR